VGTASPARILQNIQEIEEPLDKDVLARILEILKPVHNVTWPSGRPENN
jgi:L-galactose dehydrogenase